jgi:hypothetical protein
VTGAYFTAGPCAFCQRVFAFNPERVPSIPANAWRIAEITTERSVAHELGKDYDQEPPEPSQKVPICEDCLATINTLRMNEGFDPITPLPGAYDPAEGFPP